MNLIDFTKNGGYRLKQFTFRKMQEAYFQILKAFVAFMQVPDSGNYIISGCTISGANITDGWLYIDGELCKFTQTAGTLSTKIKKNVVIQSLGFKNGVNENVFRFVDAVTDPTDGAALSAFSRVSPVFDANYIHTDNNFTSALLNKLLDIETGAQVNVKPSWTAPESNANGILNKPAGDLLISLYKSTYIIGNIAGGADDIITVTFPTVGTSNYQVIPTFISGNTSGPAFDNDFTYIIDNQTPTSFDICFNEMTGHSQNITLQYILIKI